MRYKLFFFLLLMNITYLGAQDLIVTRSLDSLNFKIIGENKGRLYVEYIKNGERIVTFFSTDQVLAYYYGYYRVIDNEGFNKLKVKLSLNTGAGFWMANPGNESQAQKEYIDRLRWRIPFDIGIGLMSSSGFTTGVRVNMFFTANSEQWGYSDNISLVFIGLDMSGQHKFSDTKLSFSPAFSIGRVGFKNTNKGYRTRPDITASAIGAYFSGGFEFQADEAVSLALDFGVLTGRFKKVHIDGEFYRLISPDTAFRLNLMAGIKFIL